MIVIFVEFIDQLIDYPINCVSLSNLEAITRPQNTAFNRKQYEATNQNRYINRMKNKISKNK